MSNNTFPAVENTYMKVIEVTIAEAASLQSSAVLEQLKQRWIEKLHERLGRRTNYCVQSKSSLMENFEPSLPGLPSASQRSGEEGSQTYHDPSASVKPYTPSEDHSKSASESASKDTSISESVSNPSSEKVSQLLETSELPQPHNNDTQEEDEDGWECAEWETVHPVETTSNEATLINQNKGGETVEMLPNKLVKKSSESSTKKRFIPPTGEKGRGVVVASQEDLYNDEDIIDEDELSDLEDTEPICSDLIVAQFQAVQRPHTRKGYQKGLWRIKLKHGILQIHGKELIFNTLSGDLIF